MKQSTIAKTMWIVMLTILIVLIIHACIALQSIFVALLALPVPVCFLYAVLFKKPWYEEVTQEEEHKEK